jgi:hypothetical protein
VGDALYKARDRAVKEGALGPAHEEVITTLAASEIRSNRQLPKKSATKNVRRLRSHLRPVRRARLRHQGGHRRHPPTGRFTSTPNANTGPAPEKFANAPPHHSLRWTKSSLSHLPEVLPVQLERLVCEPLTVQYSFHCRRTRLTDFVTCTLRRRLPLLRRTPGLGLLGKLADALTLAWVKLKPGFSPREAKGFFVLATYRKPSS